MSSLMYFDLLHLLSQFLFFKNIKNNVNTLKTYADMTIFKHCVGNWKSYN